MSYSYLDHGADIGFEVRSKSKEALFVEGGEALFNLIADLEDITPSQTFSLKVTGEDLTVLFYNWLSELLSLSDLEKTIFSRFSAEITRGDGSYALEGEARGETIDPSRHELRSEVKGVTYLGLKVEQDEDGTWKGRCVVDV